MIIMRMEMIRSLPLLRDDKLRIRAMWVNSIIFKPCGKAIPYSLLEYKVRTLWKPAGNINLIDLEKP